MLARRCGTPGARAPGACSWPASRPGCRRRAAHPRTRAPDLAAAEHPPDRIRELDLAERAGARSREAQERSPGSARTCPSPRGRSSPRRPAASRQDLVTRCSLPRDSAISAHPYREIWSLGTRIRARMDVPSSSCASQSCRRTGVFGQREVVREHAEEGPVSNCLRQRTAPRRRVREAKPDAPRSPGTDSRPGARPPAPRTCLAPRAAARAADRDADVPRVPPSPRRAPARSRRRRMRPPPRPPTGSPGDREPGATPWGAPWWQGESASPGPRPGSRMVASSTAPHCRPSGREPCSPLPLRDMADTRTLLLQAVRRALDDSPAWIPRSRWWSSARPARSSVTGRRLRRSGWPECCGARRLAIAEELAARLEAAHVPWVRAWTVTPPGYVNAHLDDRSWAEAVLDVGSRSSEPRAPLDLPAEAAGGAGKTLVEHTATNPNKAAHIGHLRNACIGDTVARVLRRTGHAVEVNNYIDDTGVQVADVVVGHSRAGHRASCPASPSTSTARACTSRCPPATRPTPRSSSVDAPCCATIEEGGNETAVFVKDLARRIVNAHLATMRRFDIALRPAHLGVRHHRARLLAPGVRAASRVGCDRARRDRQARRLLGHARRTRPTTRVMTTPRFWSNPTVSPPTPRRISLTSSGSSACSAATSSTALGRVIPTLVTTASVPQPDAPPGTFRSGAAGDQRHRCAPGIPATSGPARAAPPAPRARG